MKSGFLVRIARMLLWKPIGLVLSLAGSNVKRVIKRRGLFFLSKLGFSNSLNRMDLKILDFFSGKKGVFLEVGAADGIDQSNTLVLERKYGWTGYLVEPILEQYNQCKFWRRNSCVDRLIFTSTENYRRNKYLSIKAESLESSVAASDESSHTDSFEMVETISLDEYFRQRKINQVDIFSLDVEGYEIEVLDGYSSDSGVISYMLVETWDRVRFQEYAENRGWEYIKHFGNHDYLYKIRV